MNKIRIGSPDDYPGFGVHYYVNEYGNSRGVTAAVPGEEEDKLVTHFPIDFDKITDMMAHHMAEFETGGGILDIDGFKVPKKAAARLYIDAIATILANHGISANLNLIRSQLCSKCKGSQAPAREFVGDESMTPEGVTHYTT